MTGRISEQSDVYPSLTYDDATAAVVREVRDDEYGARGYMVTDSEGHRWYFGDYRPGAYW